MKMFEFPLELTEICFSGSTGQKTSIDSIMAWRLRGDKPLSEPVWADVTDAHIRHSASMSEQWINLARMVNIKCK